LVTRAITPSSNSISPTEKSGAGFSSGGSTPLSGAMSPETAVTRRAGPNIAANGPSA
jgi:hypothetical protein